MPYKRVSKTYSIPESLWSYQRRSHIVTSSDLASYGTGTASQSRHAI